MISVQTMQLLLTGGIVGIVLGSVPTFAYLKSKGINVDGALNEADKTLQEVQPILNIATGIAPLNPIVNVIDLIDKYAVTGVKNAEQLYHTSLLTTNEDRSKAAHDTVYAALKEFNIVPSDNQKKLIDDTIEAAVNDLGHKGKSDAEKEAEKQTLKTQLTQVTTERDNLKNTIATITATANTVQATQ